MDEVFLKTIKISFRLTTIRSYDENKILKQIRYFHFFKYIFLSRVLNKTMQ